MAKSPATRATALLMPESCAGTILVHGIHHHRGQRGDADGQSETEHQKGGKKVQPVRSSDGWRSEGKEASGRR